MLKLYRIMSKFCPEPLYECGGVNEADAIERYLRRSRHSYKGLYAVEVQP